MEKPLLQPVKRIDTLLSGEAVNPGRPRAIKRHNVTSWNGKSNGELCLDGKREPSTEGIIALFQVGSEEGPVVRPAAQCHNCAYREF